MESFSLVVIRRPRSKQMGQSFNHENIVSIIFNNNKGINLIKTKINNTP